jgi:hypothetical protein
MNPSLKSVLLGISLILVGIFIQGDPGNEFHGTDYIFVIIGFLIVIFGTFYSTIMEIIDK